MAIQTVQLATADAGRVSWQYDYDDVSLLLTALRVVNNSDQGPTPGKAASRVWLVADPTRIFPPNGPQITPPGQTDDVSIPAAQAQRLQLVVSPNPRTGQLRVTNLDGEFTWPVP